MAGSLQYSVVRDHLRDKLNHRERMLGFVRMARYVLIQGPWRSWIVRWYQRRNANPPLPVRDRSIFDPIDVDEAVRRLDRDAFATGLDVPEPTVDEIVAYARAAGTKRINEPHLHCEAVRRIAHDPIVAEVASRYLGLAPILCTSKLYWTIPPARDPAGMMRAAAEGGRFHYDVADLKALTVFVYLTDVDRESGPHIAIRGSQRRSALANFRRFIDDDYAERVYGDRIEVITGPRGTCWF